MQRMRIWLSGLLVEWAIAVLPKDDKEAFAAMFKRKLMRDQGYRTH